MDFDINTLAPWVAIAITLILSILVPLFTTIANNRFQLKKAKQDRLLDAEDTKRTKRIEAYESFLVDVAAAIAFRTKENVPAAGASIGRLYLYVPADWYPKLDELHHSLYDSEWGKAEKQFTDLAKMVADENRKPEDQPSKRKKKTEVQS